MKLSGVAAAVGLIAGSALGQGYVYKDKRGISFWQQDIRSGLVSDSNPQFGIALPAASQTAYANEYIGHLVCPIPSTGAWMGFTHAPGMTGNLLLVAWPDGSNVRTDFRFAPSYEAPDQYTGNAKLSVIESKVNNTHFELFYRCQNCWSWDQGGATGSQTPSAGGSQVMGWAQAIAAPVNPSQNDAVIQQHAGSDILIAPVNSAANAAYTSWILYATGSPSTTTTTRTTSPTTGPTSPPASTCSTKTNLGPYDYIVVGAGAAGIPLSAKLAQSGKQVLLIERGPASSGRWGGTMKPSWLAGTNLTRFDVPGLDNQIYVDSTGILCPDYNIRAGCVLGGGTAVNAGLWWWPPAKDFALFPSAWQSSGMQNAIKRVFAKIPTNDAPSTDGTIYYPQAYNVLSPLFAAAGWRSIVANNAPDQKDKTFSRAEHMFIRGERGGPMATYLTDAMKLNNFRLVMNTTVTRLVRSGGTVSGVQVTGDQCGTISLKSGGKVILSAGAFGSPKILMRSGIGPTDQLKIVQGAESASMIDSTQWINLPVGYNLDDHVGTDIVVKHPNVQFYDFYGAWSNPIPADKTRYLTNRTGILAQSAPNLAMFAWQEFTGSDGIARQLQYGFRVEGSQGIDNTNSIAITQYLGRGSVSRGRAVIDGSLSMTVGTVPYFQNKVDLEVAVASMQGMIDLFSNNKSFTIAYPPKGTSSAQMFANLPVTAGSRTGNHWMGTCKMGTDSGLTGGTSVVDATAKVYGTTNLYVVDASIIPGIVSANPSALIASLGEKASELL